MERFCCKTVKTRKKYGRVNGFMRSRYNLALKTEKMDKNGIYYGEKYVQTACGFDAAINLPSKKGVDNFFHLVYISQRKAMVSFT